MIISVPGEFYVLESNEFPTQKALEEFFQELGENDILELHISSPFASEEEQVFHINKFYLEKQLNFVNLALEKTPDTFETAARTCPYDVPVPVLDQDGNCVSIVKRIPTYYEHFYRYDGELDLSFLNRYDCIILHGVNEYSIEIYKHVLPLWRGSKVCLIGAEWRDFMDVLPGLRNLSVIIADYPEELKHIDSCDNGLILHIIDGFPQNEDNLRYENGIMYYDEVMILTFMFSYVIHPGSKNPDKKFFVIDGCFQIEGIYGIWSKVFTVARYALSKGYIPAFKIISSDMNIYSDHKCDDIWNKFFLQPENHSIEEVLESSYLALSPNMNVLNTVRHIMNEASRGYELSWPKGILNDPVKKYIADRRAQFLPHPERTLGVLVRGTDYSKTRMAGHARHASVDMIIQKIEKVKDSWDFDRIYLATEDMEICEKMKAYYGERLICTDQERYVISPGQLLMDLHRVKKEGEGFRLGVEYMCSVSLLSECNSLIASGNCGAYAEALRINNGKYGHIYKFEL